MVINEFLAQMRVPTDLTATPIPEEDILRSLEGARWAPSANNEQVWRFLTVVSQPKKEAVVEAVEQQDSRLTGAKQGEFKELAGADRDKMSFTFTRANYDASTDVYRQSIEAAHDADVTCARSASLFIICTYLRKFVSKFYGGLEIGGAILHILLLAQKAGHAVRIIRNFNREKIYSAFGIPDNFELTAILAIGDPVSGEEISPPTPDEEENRAAHGVALEDLILDRRSVRAYAPEKIPGESIDMLQSLGSMIPAFTGERFVEIIPVTDPEMLRKVAGEARIVFVKQKHVGIAPAVFGVAYNATGSAGFYGQADTGMAVQSILLEAFGLGIGTCWIGAFSHGRMRNVLGLPDTCRMESLVTMGYPAEYPEPSTHLLLGRVAFRERWKAPFVTPPSVGFSNSKVTNPASILRDRPAGNTLVPRFNEIGKKF
jgi:nitroreductase